jgi:Family of unknown function (DUF6282)
VSDRVASTVDTGETREVLHGGVDLYVDTSPDLLPRRVDDVGLASQMRADGFRATMMWNQFSHTGERATVASGVTGFDMRGSIILNGTVGGLNARVTEHAIRMGARLREHADDERRLLSRPYIGLCTGGIEDREAGARCR